MNKEELVEELRKCDLSSVNNVKGYIVSYAVRNHMYLDDEEVEEIYKTLSSKNVSFIDRVVNYLINVIKINKWEDWELTAQDYGHRLFERYIKSVVDEFKVKYKVEVTPEMMVEIESKVIPQWR